MGVILFSGWYNEMLCRKYPELRFVFGDNLRRFGKGGQAIIRDEPNAVGVATKRKPSMSEGSFFKEGDESDLDHVLNDIETIWRFLEEGRDVVIPITATGAVSLGRERAELPSRAPTIMQTIEMHIAEMCAAYGSRIAKDGDAL